MCGTQKCCSKWFLEKVHNNMGNLSIKYQSKKRVPRGHFFCAILTEENKSGIESNFLVIIKEGQYPFILLDFR